jgi:hypothetical protein
MGEMLVVLGIIVLLFCVRGPKGLASDLQESLDRFNHALHGLRQHAPVPQIDLRGIEWLALALLVLFLELIYLAAQY